MKRGRGGAGRYLCSRYPCRCRGAVGAEMQRRRGAEQVQESCRGGAEQVQR